METVITTKQQQARERITEAVRKYSTDLRRLAFSYLRCVADAEDAVQDVFFSYYRNSPNLDNEEHEKAWLIRATVNRCRDKLRSPWHKKRSEYPLAEDIAADLPQEQSELLYAVMALDIKYRLPLHLYYYEGYSIEEIAQLLDTPKSTISTRLRRAREQLKHELGGNYDEENI